jgi:hypothetical protein
MGFSGLFRAEFNGWNLRWFELAISTVWKLAMRGSSTQSWTQQVNALEEERVAKLAEDVRISRRLRDRANDE